jgi:hypothetical protein
MLQEVVQHGGECESNRKMSSHEFQGEGFELQGRLLKIQSIAFKTQPNNSRSTAQK